MKKYQQPITEVYTLLDTEYAILAGTNTINGGITGPTSTDYIQTMPVSGDFLSDPSFNVRNISGEANWD